MISETDSGIEMNECVMLVKKLFACTRSDNVMFTCIPITYTGKVTQKNTCGVTKQSLKKKNHYKEGNVFKKLYKSRKFGQKSVGKKKKTHATKSEDERKISQKKVGKDGDDRKCIFDLLSRILKCLREGEHKKHSSIVEPCDGDNSCSMTEDQEDSSDRVFSEDQEDISDGVWSEDPEDSSDSVLSEVKGKGLDSRSLSADKNTDDDRAFVIIHPTMEYSFDSDLQSRDPEELCDYSAGAIKVVSSTVETDGCQNDDEEMDEDENTIEKQVYLRGHLYTDKSVQVKPVSSAADTSNDVCHPVFPVEVAPIQCTEDAGGSHGEDPGSGGKHTDMGTTQINNAESERSIHRKFSHTSPFSCPDMECDNRVGLTLASEVLPRYNIASRDDVHKNNKYSMNESEIYGNQHAYDIPHKYKTLLAKLEKFHTYRQDTPMSEMYSCLQDTYMDSHFLSSTSDSCCSCVLDDVIGCFTHRRGLPGNSWYNVHAKDGKPSSGEALSVHGNPLHVCTKDKQGSGKTALIPGMSIVTRDDQPLAGNVSFLYTKENQLLEKYQLRRAHLKLITSFVDFFRCLSKLTMNANLDLTIDLLKHAQVLEDNRTDQHCNTSNEETNKRNVVNLACKHPVENRSDMRPVEDVVDTASDVLEPLEVSLPIVEPLEVSLSLVEPLEVSLPIVEPLEVSLSLVEPLEVSLPIVEPLEVSLPIVEPLEVSLLLVEPLEVSLPLVEPLEVSLPLVEPLEVSLPLVEPLEVSLPLVEPFEVSLSLVALVEPFEVSLSLVEPFEVSLPLVEPLEGSLPIVEPLEVSLPIVEPVESAMPLDVSNRMESKEPSQVGESTINLWTEKLSRQKSRIHKRKSGKQLQKRKHSLTGYFQRSTKPCGHLRNSSSGSLRKHFEKFVFKNSSDSMKTKRMGVHELLEMPFVGTTLQVVPGTGPVNNHPTMNGAAAGWRETDHRRPLAAPQTVEELSNVFEEISTGTVTGSFKYEWARFKTFWSFPLTSPAQPTSLARGGFYFTGQDDKVVCFSCGASYSNWQRGETVDGVHYRIASHCPFLKGEDVSNVPIHRRPVSPDQNTDIRGVLDPSEEEARLMASLTTPARITSMMLGLGEPPNRDTGRVMEQQAVPNIVPNVPDTRRALQNSIDERTSNFALTVTESTRAARNSSGPSRTSQSPPSTPTVSASTPPPHQWRSGSSANQQTAPVDQPTNQQTAPVAQPTNQQTAVSVTQTPASTPATQQPALNQQHPMTFAEQFEQRQQELRGQNEAGIAANNLGIATARPRYPNYAALTVRSNTYNGFPNHLDQTPLEMARAGFFYAGYGDYVRCFFCGGGLRNWEPGDDPWVEHARWFPRCTYVKQNKGQTFINMVLQRQTELNLPNEYVNTRESTTANQTRTQTASAPTPTTVNNSSSADQTWTQTASAPAPSTANNSYRPAQITDEDMNSPAGVCIREMGYDDHTLRKAIQQFRSHQGPAIITAEILLEIIFGFVDDDIPPDNTRPSVPSSAAQQQTGDRNPTPPRNTTPPTGKKTPESQEVTEPHDPRPSRQRDRDDSSRSYTEKELKSIQEENNQLKEQMKCKICMDNIVCISFLPCGHLCCCAECAPAMVKCPICRQVIRGSVKTYLS